MKGLANVVEIKVMQHFGLVRYHTLKAVVDTIWSAMCIATLPVLFALSLQLYQGVNDPIRLAESRTVYYKSTHEDLQIPSPVVIGTSNAGKSVYYVAWIEDSAGKKVFTYPTMSFRAEASQDIRLQFPSHLTEGTYTVKGQLRYAANPIQEVTVDLGFGKVTVY